MPCFFCDPVFCRVVAWTGLTKARSQGEFHSGCIFIERVNCLLILANAGCGKGLHGTNDGLEIGCSRDLPRQAFDGSTHGVGFVAGLAAGTGWSGANARFCDFEDRLPIVIAELIRRG
jgi:hypothetical protein